MLRPRVTVAQLMAIVLFVGFVFAALTINSKKNAEIAHLSARINQLEQDGYRQKETLTAIIREMRDQLDRHVNTLELPDGQVTNVDFERREVLINITRRQDARPKMKMSIFDSTSPRVPAEKSKGTIELIEVGEQFSTARILKTNDPVERIRVGDIVYSPTWSPNTPMRFALVGKMDLNRDDKDDRDALKRMIQESGGTVDFDLPPPDAGTETGTLSPRIDWYIIDNSTPLKSVHSSRSEESLSRQAPIKKRMGEVIKEARLNGTRPLTLERLLALLGYGMSQPVLDRPEAVDLSRIQRATGPSQPGKSAAKRRRPLLPRPGRTRCRTTQPKTGRIPKPRRGAASNGTGNRRKHQNRRVSVRVAGMKSRRSGLARVSTAVSRSGHTAERRHCRSTI